MLFRWGRISQQVIAPEGTERQAKERAVQLSASQNRVDLASG